VAAALGPPGELVARYRDVLPFALTPEQEQALREEIGQLMAELTQTKLGMAVLNGLKLNTAGGAAGIPSEQVRFVHTQLTQARERVNGKTTSKR
jgi:hypothetical protein